MVLRRWVIDKTRGRPGAQIVADVALEMLVCRGVVLEAGVKIVSLRRACSFPRNRQIHVVLAAIES
eukprot:4803686-Lingulodinium_polyedra.AAC.1